MDDLRIKLSTTINQDKSLENINSAIRKIENHPNLKKINLKIEVDKQLTQTINKFIAAVSRMNKIADDQNRVVSETQNVYKKLDGTVETTTQQILKNGEIVNKTRKVHDESKKAIQAETVANKNLEDSLKSLNQAELDQIRIRENANKKVTNIRTTSTEGTTRQVQNLDPNTGNVLDTTTTLNLKQQRELELAQERLIEKIKELGSAKELINLQERAANSKTIKELNEIQKEYQSIYDWVNKSADTQQKNAIQSQQANLKLIQTQEKEIQNNQEITRQLEHELRLYQRQAEIQVQNLRRRYNRGIDNIGLDEWLKGVKELDISVPDVKRKMRELSVSFKEIEAAAKTSGSRVVSFGEQFAVAFERVPIWMASMTAFYGTLRSIQSAVSQIIEIDSNLIQLARVLPESANIDDMLQSSLDIANELGNKLTNIQQAMIGFGQAGFSEEQIVALTRTSTIMSNISELSADEAMNTLTAAMIQYNIAAEDSLTISDQLNIISNKMPVSFKNLALGVERSSSVAKTFGVDLATLLGHLTSISSSTRETGRIVGNALEVIYSRIGTMDEAIKELNAIGIQSQSQSAAKSIEMLAERWGDLSDQQRQNIGIAVAGRDQLARFLALLNNFSMAQEATALALNSTGNSLVENSIYMESLEARINKLRNGWSELSLAMGDAIITDSLIATIELLKDLSGTSQSVIETVGLLPPTLGLVGFAAAGLSKNFRTLTIATLTLGKGMKALNISAKAARASLMGLAATTGVGVLFVGLGFALEGLITKFSEAKQKQEEFEEQQKKIANNWIDQKDKVSSLLEELETLQKTDERYLQVSNEIAELMPNLVSHIDDKGNAHIKVGDALQRELEYTEKLASLEQKQKVLDSEGRFQEDLKEIEKIDKKIDSLNAKLALGGKFISTGFGATFIPYSESEMNQFEIELLTLQNKIATSSNSIRDEFNSLILTILDINEVEINDDVSAKLEKLSENLELEGLSAEKLTEKAHAISAFFTSVNSLNASKSTEEAKVLSDTVFKLGNSLGFTEIQIQSFIDSLKNKNKEEENAVDSSVLLQQQIDELNKNFELTKENLTELSSAYQTLSEGEQLSADTLINLIDKYPELASHLANTNDLTFNKGELIKQVAELERQARLQEAQNALDAVENTRKELEDKQKLYSEFYQKMLDAGTVDAWMFSPVLSKVEQARLDDAIKQADELRARIAILSQPLTFFSPRSSSSKKGKDPADEARKQREEAFREDVAHFKWLVEMQKWSTQEQIDGWNRIAKKHKQYLNEDKDAYRDYTLEVKRLTEQLNQERLTATQKYFENRNKAIAEYDDRLLQSERLQTQYVEGSDKWTRLEEEQIAILKEKQQALHLENEWIRNRLKQNETAAESERLTAEQIEFLNEQLKANSDAWWEADQAIRSSIKNLEDVQKEYEKAQEQYKDALKDSVKEAMDLLEDYYDKQNELEQESLDKSLDSYEEYINERKKLLNRSFEEEDFQKERTKLQEEELKLRKRIDLLKLDNSWEAIHEREGLEEELQDILEQIGELELDRNRKLREDNYDDLLENKRKETEATKEAAEKRWQEELQADEHYSSLRQALLDNNISLMETSLQKFSNNVQSYMEEIGDSIQMNLIDKLDMTQRFNDFTDNIPKKPKPVDETDDGSHMPVPHPQQNQVEKAWKEYLENKRKAEQQFEETGVWNETLRNRNNVLRNLYNFIDGSYDELKKHPSPVFSAETGGMTPAWGKGGKFLLAHEKELILNKFDTSNLLKVVDVTRNIFDRFSPPDLNKIMPTPVTASTNNGDTNYNFNVHIDRVEGGKEGADKFFAEVKKGMKARRYQ